MSLAVMAGDVVPPKVADAMGPLGPRGMELRGFLGERVAGNVHRLKDVDLEPLLAGFRVKPGSHPWIGEHIGKWMHAATLAWEQTADAELRRKLDYAAVELGKAQEADGYLGTYEPGKRFGLEEGSDWDVWSHKYCLIGLLAYARAMGEEGAGALLTARRAGDLLVRTFGEGGDGGAGDGAARKSILSAGTHVGMAATSVLEPMVLLYRGTGDERYLEFARSIVRAWDEPGGPAVLSGLLEHGSVSRVANGKAYEMLSNLVGLCELYRATGEGGRRYLDAARNGWEDVVRNQLYITGTASWGEHFHADHDLPNGESSNVGETCVTVTWIQLCTQLLRITGEARYGDEIERSVYNQLAAAQRGDGGAWCYYTALDGGRPYRTDTNCCLSSGPRGVAMEPGLVFLRGRAGEDEVLVVNLFEPARAEVEVGGSRVRAVMETGFPRAGGFRLVVEPLGGPARFALMVRAPRWAEPVTSQGALRDARGWLVIPAREWHKDEPVEVSFHMRGCVEAGVFGNAGKAAVCWGPVVLAYDEGLNEGRPAAGLWLREGFDGGPMLPDSELRFRAPVWVAPSGEKRAAVLVPFAAAGRGRSRVWLGAPGAFDEGAAACSLLLGAEESRSAPGNVEGSICDGDERTFVVTFGGDGESWFAAAVREPIEFRRVEFAHGRTFGDGGWFDASAGPPRVEVQTEAGGAWERIGELASYPATTAADAAGLKGGERFTLALTEPVRAVAVRVVGASASGVRAAGEGKSFGSCAELSVYGR